MRLERKHGRNVAVPEEADGEAEETKIHEGAAVGKDVGVLVARRPVANRESLLDLERTHGQALQELPVTDRQLFGRPARGRERDGIEEIPGIESGDDLVVVAANRD